MTDKQLKETLFDIQKNIAKVQYSQERINIGLFGDKDAKIKGVFEKVDEHGQFIKKAKVAGIFGIGAIFGFPALREYIKNHFGI